MSFIVHALPRSRTAWLATFLTYGGWTCLHEWAITMRSIEDVVKLFRTPNMGAAETAAGYGWQLLAHHVPELKTVVVRRPVADVVDAMMNVDVAGVAVYDRALLETTMVRGARVLDRISAQPGVLTVDFADLSRADTCAAVFEHCLPIPFDRGWFEHLKEKNIQADVKSVILYYHANREAVEGFKKTAKAELRRLAYAGHIRSTGA